MLIIGFVSLWLGVQSLSTHVTTPYGPVEGFEHGSAIVFLGIPYARPPVGPLRFEKPERTDGWNETREAKAFGPACHATMQFSKSDSVSSEDCLFLNIMAPQRDSSTPYPVIFYVHGGGFETGSASQRGYKDIVENFVNEDLVFVTINYRLGPFGFLTTGDDVLPGNLGLWDQQLALQLVNEMIAAFGGDPTRITVMGQSAGAMSVSSLTLSPHSNHLFQQAIQMSGSSYTLPLEGVREHGLDVIQMIGCDRQNLVDAKRCLKEKSWEDILAASLAVAPPLSSGNRTIGSLYYPYIDGRFFPKDLHTLTREAPVIPTIAGVVEAEGALFVFDDSNSTFIEVPLEKAPQFTADHLKWILRKAALDVPELYPLLEQFYVSRAAPSTDYKACLTQLVDAASDLGFVVPAFQEAMAKLQRGWPVYLYIEKYYSESPLRNLFPVEGSYHSNELPYLFGSGSLFPLVNSTQSWRFQRNLLKSLTTFAKSGKPKTMDSPWKPLSSDDHFRYMELNVTSTMKTGFFKDRVKFWTSEVTKKVDPQKLRYMLPQATRHVYASKLHQSDHDF